MVDVQFRDGISSVEDARVPSSVPIAAKGRITRKIKKITLGDGSTVHGCNDCTYMAPSFNAVAAHRKVHLTKNLDPTGATKAPKKVVSSIRGTHLETLLHEELIAVVDKVTFADKENVLKLERELSKTKAALSTERAARRKAERTLKRIKSAI